VRGVTEGVRDRAVVQEAYCGLQLPADDGDEHGSGQGSAAVQGGEPLEGVCVRRARRPQLGGDIQVSAHAPWTERRPETNRAQEMIFVRVRRFPPRDRARTASLPAPAGTCTRTPPRALRTPARRPFTVAETACAPAGRRTRTHRAGHLGAGGASAQGIAVELFVKRLKKAHAISAPLGAFSSLL
jgi:hypothetical protein